MNKNDDQSPVSPFSGCSGVPVGQTPNSVEDIHRLKNQHGKIADTVRTSLYSLKMIDTVFMPTFKAAEFIQKNKPAVEYMNPLEDIMASIIPWGRNVNSIAVNARSRPRFVNVWEYFFQNYKERIGKYPKLEGYLNILAMQGWFVSLDLPLSAYENLAFSLDKLAVDSDETALIDALFIECLQAEIEYLCKTLTEGNPHRAFAIQPAVAAHLRGEYALSVPVFFSQAEGIVRDRTERELFTRPKGKPWEHVNDWAKKKRVSVLQTEDPFEHFEDALWAPLALDLPITWSPQKRREHEYTGLNRNTTLHGIDLGYASEVNSLKAFSLLCYVSSVLSTDPKMQAEEGQE